MRAIFMDIYQTVLFILQNSNISYARSRTQERVDPIDHRTKTQFCTDPSIGQCSHQTWTPRRKFCIERSSSRRCGQTQIRHMSERFRVLSIRNGRVYTIPDDFQFEGCMLRVRQSSGRDDRHPRQGRPRVGR
jgi:hypothetical protein